MGRLSSETFKRKLRIPAAVPVVAHVFAIALVAGGATLVGSDPATGDPEAVNPLMGMSFFVDPENPASRQVRRWASERPADARELRKIASQPQADWFGDWNRDVKEDVSRRVRQARQEGATPVLVAYNIPLRDCGSHSAGGAESADHYRAWIRDFADGLGGGPAVVVLEPDAVAGADCLSPGERRERFELIAHAVDVLTDRRGTRVYVDAGNPYWKSAEEMASRLREAGIVGADGFALNVSNTVSTETNVRYGEEISELLQGLHFVIDTSRNGLGAPADREWCNPSGRALGPAPTVDTGHAAVDAFLWVKRPGESDGECNGGPRAGQWWPEYALGLASRSDRVI